MSCLGYEEEREEGHVGERKRERREGRWVGGREEEELEGEFSLYSFYLYVRF